MDTREKQHERNKFQNQAFRTAAIFEVIGEFGKKLGISATGGRRIIEQLMMDYYDDVEASTKNKAKSIADKPNSKNSKKLRKLLDKIEVCK